MMEPTLVAEIGKETIWVLLKLSMPLLLVALVVGLLISLFQALTQIQEPTLSYKKKIIAIFITLLLALGFIGSTMSTYTDELMAHIVNIE